MAYTGSRDQMRDEYRADVRDMAAQVIEWWKSEPDADRDALIEYIDESIDGCGRVIYTASAQECLLVSENDNAGIEELGAGGFDWSGGIPWSQLAYFAFRADVIDRLSSEGLDVNNPEHEQPDEDEADDDDSEADA